MTDPVQSEVEAPVPSEAERPVAVRVRRLPHGHGLALPAYATSGAAGMDVLAAEHITLVPGARHAVATGFAVAIPPGYEIQVRPRSGLALKHGVTVLNAPGTIDADYRGEVAVLLVNLGPTPYTIKRGDRIAQIVIARVAQPSWEEVAGLSESARGAGGFGSTGNR